MFDERDLRHLVRNQQRVWEDGTILVVEPMKDFYGQLDFHAAWDVEKGSRPNECFMQSSEFRRAKWRRLRHEMFTEKIFVLEQTALECLQNHATSTQFLRQRITAQ